MNWREMNDAVVAFVTGHALPGRLLLTSVEFAVLALAVGLLIFVLRLRQPRLRALLWLMVLAKPLAGLALGTPLPLLLLTPPAQGQAVGVAAEPVAVVSQPLNLTRITPQYAMEPVDVIAPASMPVDCGALALKGALGLWLAGCGVMALRLARGQWKLRRMIRAAAEPPAWLEGRLAEAARALGIEGGKDKKRGVKSTGQPGEIGPLQGPAADRTLTPGCANTLHPGLLRSWTPVGVGNAFRFGGGNAFKRRSCGQDVQNTKNGLNARDGVNTSPSACLPSLRVTDVLESPALAGFWRPVILVPAWLCAEADPLQVDWALRHELMHWRLRDPLASLLRELARIFFFFHPAAWWAGRKWQEATEMACDRALIHSMEDAEMYVQELYRMLLKVRAQRRVPVAGGLFAGRTQISQRIASLARDPLRAPARLSVATVGLVVLLSFASLSVGVGVKSRAADNKKQHPETINTTSTPNTRSVTIPVRDEAGKPMAGVEVYLIQHIRKGPVPANLDLQKLVMGPVRTDAQGKATFPSVMEFENTALNAYARIPGKMVGFMVKYYGEHASQTPHPLQVTMHPVTKVQGTVTAPAGYDLSEITVRVVCFEVPESKGWPEELARLPWPSTTTPDKQGRYTLTDLPQTSRILLVVDGPGLARTLVGGATPDDPKAFKIRMEPEAVIEGSVRNADGQPVAGATVVANPLGWSWIQLPFKTTTDRTGIFTIKGVRPERYAVRVLMAGNEEEVLDGMSRTVSVKSGQTARGIDLKLSSQRPVRPKNTGAANTPEKESGITLATASEVRTDSPAHISEADKLAAEDLAATGWRLWQQRKLAEAEAAFKKALEKDSTNANTWNGLGWAQLNQGKQLNAKKSFEEAVKRDPKQAGALNGLGWIAKGAGKTDEAIGYWKRAVAAVPEATAALAGLARTYLEQKHYKEAERYFEQWLKAEPESAEAKDGLEKAKAGAAGKPPTFSEAELKKWIVRLDDPKAPPFEALNVIIRMGPEAVPGLIDAMKTSGNWQVPKALGAIGDKRATLPLIEKLEKNPWSPIKEVIGEALENITGQKLGTDAKAWRKWWNEKKP